MDDDPQRVLQLCADLGIPVLGLGRSRLATPVPGNDHLVYKFAWRQLGIAENNLEYRVYQQASDELRQVLAPIEALLDSGVLVQGRCQPSELGAEAAQVLSILSGYGIVDGVVNLGRYQQRIVCYDYALLGTERFFQITSP